MQRNVLDVPCQGCILELAITESAMVDRGNGAKRKLRVFSHQITNLLTEILSDEGLQRAEDLDRI